MDFGYLWSDLKFSSTNAAGLVAGSINWRFEEETSRLEFKNPRYKSVFVHIAKQLAMSEIEGQLHKIVPKFKKHLEDQSREYVLEQQKRNLVSLIENQEKQSKDWGKIKTESGHVVVAKDKYGSPVKEALILYYDDQKSHSVEDVSFVHGKSKAIKYNTKTVFHIDLSPQVSMNSSKNIVMTQVQGRDYTRKELVSGGDLQFSVSGNIVSDERGLYPVEAVKKFIKMMEYNGILNVNFMMFGSFNVNRVIIKDYSLNQQTYKNIQPYSFNCVAVEPDEAIEIKKDTISVLNKELKLSPMNKWYRLILNNKLAEMAANAVANTASSAVVSGVGAGLDELVPNI